jgi:hypothetical protein
MADRPTLRPEPSARNSMGDEAGDVRYNHDAFAIARVMRPTYGGGINLFGSELRHSNVVAIEIVRAETDRHLSTNWNHGDETIVEIIMSEAQWAQMVASHGSYSGTPVTLNYAPPRGTKTKAMPYIELEGFVKVFDREIQQKTQQYLEGIQAQLEQINALMAAPGSLPKTELKALVRDLTIKAQNLPSNMAYIQKCLHETVEQTVSDGKVELEAFQNNLAHRLGMDEIRKMGPRIESDSSDRPPMITLDAIQIAEFNATKDPE